MLTVCHVAEAVPAHIIPPGENYANNLGLLLQLNKTDGGLTAEQLSMILCKCRYCGRIFTKHVFYRYHCHRCHDTA